MLGYPPCFASKAAFNEWKKTAQESGAIPASSFCHDCTPEFKAKMLAEGRCIYPGVVFVTLTDDEDGEMEPEEYTAGVRP